MYYDEVVIDLSKKRDFEPFHPLTDHMYIAYCDGDVYLYTGSKTKPINLRRVRYLRLSDDMELSISNPASYDRKCVLRFFKMPVAVISKQYVVSQVAGTLDADTSLGVLVWRPEIYERIELNTDGPISIKFAPLDEVKVLGSGSPLEGFNTYTEVSESLGEYGGTYEAEFIPFARKVEQIKLPAGVFMLKNLSADPVPFTFDILINRGGVSVE